MANQSDQNKRNTKPSPEDRQRSGEQSASNQQGDDQGRLRMRLTKRITRG
jgi:hypothetical protein